MKEVYPHYNFKRNSFFSLNGQWNLNNHTIIVPFPKESFLSEYPIKEYEEELVYTKSFILPNGFYDENKKVILHFEAVDNFTKVYLNDNYLGEHIGGYLPFSFDITKYLKKENILKAVVKDPLDKTYPYGKQSLNPSGMWYTAISGIWKTVWLEAVPIKEEIRSIKIDATINTIIINVDCDVPFKFAINFDEIEFSSTFDKTVFLDLDKLNIKYQNWDVDNPKLYFFSLETKYDHIDSYLAVREFNIQNINGTKYFCLNNKPIYLNGVLDQGYFNDGIYLPSNHEKYKQDISNMKELGFNMLRKHIKVEDDIFYYYCDKLGMLVMQDMVNSGEVNFLKNILLPTIGFVRQKDNVKDENRLNFFIEHSKETIRLLYNHPCIISWTIYNESWGQQEANKVYKLLSKEDSRPFDTCSGWYKDYLSDIDSYHIYFRNKVLKIKDKNKALFLSEYGGIKRHVKNHEFTLRKANYGYGNSNSEEGLTNKLLNIYNKMLFPSIKNGLCGSVLTQVSDVEEEENGLYTYDREICKVNKEKIRQANNLIYETFKNSLNNFVK